MPFINIPVDIAKKIKLNEDIIHELLKKGIINTREAQFLKVAIHAAKGDQNALDELGNMCQTYFGNDAEVTKNRLIKFFTQDSQVSWVLFTRTAQTIPYDETDPLEDYAPHPEVEVLIIHREHLIEKA